MPAGTVAIRPWIRANIGPKVALKTTSGSYVLARGSQSAGWTGNQITIAIKRVARSISHAQICLTFGTPVEAVDMSGALVVDHGVKTTRTRIEYLRLGHRSWLSLASLVARRMGLGRMPSGTWIAFIPLALMVTVVLLTVMLVLRQLRSYTRARTCTPATTTGATGVEHERPPDRGKRGLPLRRTLGGVPQAAWICAGIACLNAASWSIITPPFQAPDEPAHFAYVQQLAETGTLPAATEAISSEEDVALEDLNHESIMYNTVYGVNPSTTAQLRLEDDLSQPLSRRGGGAGVAASEPPLYYALQVIPYTVAAGSSLLDRLALMRLLSVLMAGLTALFAFAFISESLPRAPWAWTVGGLGVALFPLLGFMSGIVNPDSMLCAVSTALFYFLARAFRRKLTPLLAVAIGAVTALGFLTKLNFIGLLPGVILAFAILIRRAGRDDGRSTWRLAALAFAGGCPAYLYILFCVLSRRAVLGPASASATGHLSSVPAELAYIWQFYLPRLPGMARDFPGISPTREIWFYRLVGQYGWLDTSFPTWVANAALVPAGLIAALCAWGVARTRGSVRSRLAELVVYVVLAVGLLMLVGADSYLSFPARAGAYSEMRYLLPMTALFGAVLALAARGAGRYWGPSVGVLIVVLILGHDIFSQLLTISRYYA